MGSDVSHFNVSLIVSHKVTRQRPQTTFFERSESRSRIEPRSLPLGQTGSRVNLFLVLSWRFMSTETVRFIRDWHINTLPGAPFISAPVHFTSVQHGDGNPPVKHSEILLTSLGHYCRHADSVSLCQAKLTLTSLGLRLTQTRLLSLR